MEVVSLDSEKLLHNYNDAGVQRRYPPGQTTPNGASKFSRFLCPLSSSCSSSYFSVISLQCLFSSRSPFLRPLDALRYLAPNAQVVILVSFFNAFRTFRTDDIFKFTSPSVHEFTVCMPAPCMLLCRPCFSFCFAILLCPPAPVVFVPLVASPLSFTFFRCFFFLSLLSPLLLVCNRFRIPYRADSAVFLRRPESAFPS